MVKRIKKITKSKPTRERKRIIVVGTEGNNKTEETYFHMLEKKQNKYHLIFAEGNDTDPVNIVKNTLSRAKAEELVYKQGDMAVSIFDLDVDVTKKEQLQEAKEISRGENICIVTSNPCFELWYLEHFGFTSKPFNSSTDLIAELKKHIPKYQKNQLDFETLYPLTKGAIKNCEALDKYHEKNGSNSDKEFNNPRTNVYELVRTIIEETGSGTIRKEGCKSDQKNKQALQ